MLECHSATPATRNEATRLLKYPSITFAELSTDTCEQLRTVADGCKRLRTVAQPRANTQPEWNGNPCYAFGKNIENAFFRMWRSVSFLLRLPSFPYHFQVRLGRLEPLGPSLSDNRWMWWVTINRITIPSLSTVAVYPLHMTQTSIDPLGWLSCKWLYGFTTACGLRRCLSLNPGAIPFSIVNLTGRPQKMAIFAAWPF